MNAREYLDAAKAAMQISSDYELARRFEIPTGHITLIHQGKRPMSAYLCAKVAITLNLDPARVIADIEEQTEKNATRKEFWRSFLARASMVAAVCIMLACGFSASCGNAPGVPGGSLSAVVGTLILAGATLRIMYELCRSSTMNKYCHM